MARAGGVLFVLLHIDERDAATTGMAKSRMGRVLRAEPLLDGFGFPEGARWHDGALWFSDISRGHVLRCPPRRTPEVVAVLPRVSSSSDYLGPSGLGFLPDGSALVVAMTDARVYRIHDGELALYADLRPVIEGRVNDMVVDGQGRAYIGAMDDNEIILVRPDGQLLSVVDDVVRPNGMAITSDGSMMIVSSNGRSLYAADILPDGTLGPRRIWADVSVEGALRRRMVAGDLNGVVTWAELTGSVTHPDGICLDEEGGLWVGGAYAQKFIRLEAGGHLTDVVHLPGRIAASCALGGEDRRTLFMVSAQVEPSHDGRGDEASDLLTKIAEGRCVGFVDTVRVEIAGSGWP